MKEITAYEYEDLDPETQKEIFEKWINEAVLCELNMWEESIINGSITEKEFYDEVGCSKDYALSTPWFVPTVYYENHREEIDETVRKDLKNALFTKDGRFIQMKRGL